MLNKTECFSERLGDYWPLYFNLVLRTGTWNIVKGGRQVTIFNFCIILLAIKKNCMPKTRCLVIGLKVGEGGWVVWIVFVILI